MNAELLLRCDGALPGERNMAIDRALLQCYEAGELRSPLLRIYSWDPPAVSLGFHQSEEGLDVAALRERGVDLVHRPSGGAAVFHCREWTYAVAGPLGSVGLGRNFREIYASLAAALVGALRGLGVAAESEGEGGPESFVCFEALRGHEISVGGRKLVGSAFRQTRHAFLQHGSLLVGPDHAEIVDFLRHRDERERMARRARLRRRTTSLEELGHPRLSAERFAEAFGAALALQVGARLRRLEQYPPPLLHWMNRASTCPPGRRILP